MTGRPQRRHGGEALVEHDSIIFRVPFSWYIVPGIMTEWLDLAFACDCADGSSDFTLAELLKPLINTADLTGMTCREPILSCGMAYIPDSYNAREEAEERARPHAGRPAACIAG
jgi:putative NADPH-quinone reductase